MREIKFRAWDKTERCWDVPKTEYSIQEGAKKLFYRKNEIVRFNRADIILMQYTGLKDKNGKEIYEGDVLKIINYTLESDIFINTVTFNRGRWQCGVLPLYNFFEVGDTIEIIDNICENPELLEEKNK